MIKNWKSLKLNIKFTIVILALLIVPFIMIFMLQYSNMRSKEISEAIRDMEYDMGKDHDMVQNHIESINMSIQFVLGDDNLHEFLADVKKGRKRSSEQIREFYLSDISSLERMVNNNPYLYQVRVYAAGYVQEMMPILYEEERLLKLSWGAEEDCYGWQFNYEDTIFDSGTNRQSILSYVTEVEDTENGHLGVLEASIAMETMFPVLYEKGKESFACFVEQDGTVHYSQDIQEEEKAILQEILKEEFTESTSYYHTRFHKKELVVGYMEILELTDSFIYVEDIGEKIAYIYSQQSILIVLMLILFVAVAVVVSLVVKKLLKQFYEILSSMRQIEKVIWTSE